MAAAVVKDDGPGDTEDLEAALRKLFDAYDYDGTGNLQLREYLQVTIRTSLDTGRMLKAGSALAWMSTAKRDSGGLLNFERFQEHQVNTYKDEDVDNEELANRADADAKKASKLRGMMGLRFDLQGRALLKEIYRLIHFRGAGDGIEPAEWILASRHLGPALSAWRRHLDVDWFGEKAFIDGDVSGAGVLRYEEFLKLSYGVMEVAGYGTSGSSEGAIEVLDMIRRLLSERHESGMQLTELVAVYPPTREIQYFFPPQHASIANIDPENEFRRFDRLRLPLKIDKVEDLAAIFKMHFHIPAAMLLSTVYCNGSDDISLNVTTQSTSQIMPSLSRSGSRSGQRARSSSRVSINMPEHESSPQGCVALMRPTFGWNDASRRNSVAHAVDCLQNQPGKQGKGFYIKNVRLKPQRLTLQAPVSMSDDMHLKVTSNLQWGFHWEVQIFALGKALPQNFALLQAESIVFEVPRSSPNGRYQYNTSIYMDNAGVLSAPQVRERGTSTKKAARKRKPDDATVQEADTIEQLVFYAQRPGHCTLFVEVSWESGEDRFAEDCGSSLPCPFNTIARIGPLEVEVQSADVRNTSILMETRNAVSRALWEGTRSKQQSNQKAVETKWWDGRRWTTKRAIKEICKRNLQQIIAFRDEAARSGSLERPSLRREFSLYRRPSSARRRPSLARGMSSDRSSSRPSSAAPRTSGLPVGDQLSSVKEIDAIEDPAAAAIAVASQAQAEALTLQPSPPSRPKCPKSGRPASAARKLMGA